MDDRIHLQIVTAKGVVYDGQASALNIPLDGGSIGVLADHAPLMGAVTTGVVEISHADGTKDYTAVGIGVLIATREPEKKRVGNYYPVLYLDNDPGDRHIIISPNEESLEEHPKLL